MIPRARHIFNFISWKSILILATCAFLVQTINVTLSWYIQKKSTDLRKFEYNSQSFGHMIEDVLNHINQFSILDSSGEFQVVSGVLKGSNWPAVVAKSDEVIKMSNVNAVTLVTHCSLYHAHLIPELAKQWQGPISVAVFLLKEEMKSGVETLIKLHRCFIEVEANVTFSLVFPQNYVASDAPFSSTIEDSCDYIENTLAFLNKTNYEFENRISYPNNLLRNAAHKIIVTKFLTVLDIDLVPSYGLHSAFTSYVSENGLLFNNTNGSNDVSKTVWILPSYEVKDGIPPPQHKSDLLSLRRKGFIRPFYQELCWKCQKYTNYDAWESNLVMKNDSNSTLKLIPLYEVIWKDPWEPFYIATADVPLYDERFRQYGFNRISQVCELHVSGYRFLVLNSAFVVHRGYKTTGRLHTSKDKEQERNRILFRQFKKDLKNKYPQSSRRCY